MPPAAGSGLVGHRVGSQPSCVALEANKREDPNMCLFEDGEGFFVSGLFSQYSAVTPKK